jgi:catechol 2,3-dioxygenase-like lactoylglutathione lyase family enzyme
MATRLVHVTIDAADPAEAATFWADALGWEADTHLEDEAEVAPAGFAYPGTSALPLVFVRVAEPKTVKNRVHLDLASTSPEHYAAIVDRLLGLGAVKADIGQGDVPWEVMADPFGNEFCVLEPRAVYMDTGPVAAVVVDCADTEETARFWSVAAGWPIGKRIQDVIQLRSPDGAGPYLEMLPSSDQKRVKNRVHLEVAPYADGNAAAEAAALQAAGARLADVGQGEVSWIVLRDPDGQEFCVLSPR